MVKTITCKQFKERLAVLCVTSGKTTFTRRFIDRHILFKSMTFDLDNTKTYSEKEIDNNLKLWLTTIGERIDVDHVNLRRLLIDYGYLKRNRAGTSYQLTPANYDSIAFEADIDNIDQPSVIRKQKILIEQKKRKY